MAISLKIKALSMALNFINGRKTKVAKDILMRTENQGSTCPAKYTPIRLNEKAQTIVVTSKYAIKRIR